MIKTDEDALICDFAETYGIYDYKALPVSLMATLAVGLREDSRIKMKQNGIDIKPEILLLASIADNLAFLSWSKTTDAENNINRPKSMVGILLGENQNDENKEIMSFETKEEFENAREEIIRGIS